MATVIGDHADSAETRNTSEENVKQDAVHVRSTRQKKGPEFDVAAMPLEGVRCSSRSTGALHKELAGHIMGQEVLSSHVEEDVQNITMTLKFKLFIITLVVANAIQMGLMHMIPDWDDVFYVADNVFTCAFVLEAGLKIYYERVGYFKDAWNVLDFALVLLAVIDEWILLLVFHHSGQGMKGFTALRIFRLLRVLRVLKVLRMRKDLLILVEGMTGALRAMMPVTVLLMLAIYAMALVILEVVRNDADRLSSGTPPLEIDLYFGSLGRTCLTLFSMVIVDVWGDVVWPMVEPMPYVVLILLVFVMVCSFGILNIIIGIVCEQVAEASQRLQDDLIRCKKCAQMKMVEQITQSLIDTDSNKDGVISAEEFKALPKSQRDALLAGMDLPYGFTDDELMRMVDGDGKNSSAREFAVTMLRMVNCEDFQSACVHGLHFQDIKTMLSNFEEKSLTKMDMVSEEVRSLQSRLEALERVIQPISVEQPCAPREPEAVQDNGSVVHEISSVIEGKHQELKREMSGLMQSIKDEALLPQLESIRALVEPMLSQNETKHSDTIASMTVQELATNLSPLISSEVAKKISGEAKAATLPVVMSPPYLMTPDDTCDTSPTRW